MEVLFKKTFIKDFEKLPSGTKEKVKEICLFIFPENETPGSNVSNPGRAANE